MIFKTTITDLNKMAVAIDKISNMTLPNYSGLSTAIDGLTAKQVALVLSTRNLSQAELEEVVKTNNLIEKYGAEQLVKTGLLSANSSLLVSEKAVSAEKLKEEIIQESLNKEKAKEFIQTQLSIVSDGEETTATVVLNKALMDEAVKRGILSKEKAKEILSTYGVINANKLEMGSKKGLAKAIGGLISANASLIASTVGITALVSVLYQLSKVAGEVRDKAQELGTSFKDTSSTINDYKSQIEDLYKVINDSGSSIEDVTTARKTLITVQDELIDKFGTEESVINNVTSAINGQTEALNELTKSKWQETKNDFAHGGFWNDTANFFEGKDNIERMLDEYGEKTILFKWADYADINKLTDEMVAELENIGIDIKVSTDNLQAIRDFDSLTESIEDTKGASLALTGNAEEIYNKLLALQNLIGNDDSFDKLYDKVGNTANSYKELTEKYKDFYDQYILQEKIFADDSKYADTFKKITDTAEKYNEAFTSGDETKIKEAADEYASLISTAMATAIANGDSDVATYFENMYPTLKSIVDGWNFNVAFDANTDDLQDKVQNVLDKLKDENGRSLTAEEILGLGEENQQYQDLVSIAHSYNMEIEEMIELLKERNLVSAMDYQGLVGLFGQENIDKLLPEDLEIAYTIKNVGNMTFEQLQAEIQKTKEQGNEIQTLFGQLNKSEESLDKFQSSIKSAADAYSTLLSGNYSSSELLDSIQAINKAATDMGESIAWEEIDSLDLLGDKLEEVSQKYAESITGIDVDGGFGKILANIIQAQKASTQLEVLNDQIDSLQTAYSNLTDIVETYNEAGYITFDQLQTLLEMEPQYLSCLIDENGQLQLNEAAMTELANKRLDDAEAQAIQQAITELGQIALQDEKQAVQENAEAFTNAIDDLANYNAELANTIAEATVGASAIRDLNAAINGAESQGATNDQINTVLNNLETKLQLIGNVRDKVASGGLGSVVKSGSGSSSSSSKDTWKETYEKELKELEHMHKLGLISDEEYWKARMDLNEKYFGESSGMHQKYLEEYQDNEEEILEGIKNLWKDYYNDRKNDLKDLISYAEKLYDKEIDSLEASIKKLEERRDTEKKYWQTQIDDLDAEIDALQDANDERERAINLQEKQWALQKAIHQHTMLLYTESSGMIYHTDDKAIRDAKNDLESAEHDNKIADLKKQQKDLQKQLDSILETYDLQIEAIEKQIDSLKEVKSAWSEIVENQEFKELEERLKSIFGDDIKDKILSGNTDFMNSIIAQYSDTSDMLRTIEDATLSDIQNMIAQYGVLPENLMPITDIINDMADGFSNVADSASNAASAISGGGNVSARPNNQASSNNISSGSTGNNSSLKDAITEASTGSVEEINKISDAFAGEDEEGISVTGAIQKVIDKVGSAESGNENSDSLMSALKEQTEAALDEESGIPAQKTAWEELNVPLGEAVESVTTLKTTLEDLDGKEFTVTLNVTGNGASYVSNFSNNHGGGGHSRVEGTAHVEGTANARGNWGTKEGGRTLVGELGQEIVVFPDGKFRTVGDNGAEFVDIPKNSIVFNHLQTRELLNKGNIVGRGRSLASGTALANGTNDEGWWIGSDGHRYRDLQPGDRAYELQKAFEPFVDKILKGEMDIVSNAVFEGQKQMERWTKEITNNTAINNISNNNQPSVHVGEIHVHCPGVTSQEVAKQVGVELNRLFSGLHLEAMQQSMMR